MCLRERNGVKRAKERRRAIEREEEREREKQGERERRREVEMERGRDGEKEQLDGKLTLEVKREHVIVCGLVGIEQFIQKRCVKQSL